MNRASNREPLSDDLWCSAFKVGPHSYSARVEEPQSLALETDEYMGLFVAKICRAMKLPEEPK